MTGATSSVLGIAAVRHLIDPALIAHATGTGEGAVVEALMPVVETARDAHGEPRWTLRTEVRTGILQKADVAQALAWSRALPVTATPDRVLERWFGGKLDLDRLAPEEGDELRRVCGWLRECGWVRPEPAAVLRQLAKAELRLKLELSVGSSFTGRVPELRQLDEIVASDARVGVVEARGGMGKSALLSRFLLDKGAFTAGGPLVAWLDFDNRAVDVREPETLFVEIARQLALQTAGLEGFEPEFRSQGTEFRARGYDASLAGRRILEDSRLFALAAYFLGRAAQASPVVVILDTLERARQASAELTDIVVEQLTRIASDKTAGRITLLVAGRGPLALSGLERAPTIALGPLSQEEAIACLQALDVEPEIAVELAGVVQRTPLTLKLAARAATQLGADPLVSGQLTAAVRRQLVDGYLYARVLAHLPSPRLAAVARHALLLRTITAERVYRIIGPLMQPPIGEAEGVVLYEQLGRVHDLVGIHDGIVLRLRPELAVELLTLLADGDDDRRMVQQVHQAALEHLSKRDDAGDDLDRVWHALSLDRVDDAEAHWPAGGAGELADLIDTLPTRARAWLRDRLERAAPLARSETEARARALLRAGRPFHALRLIDREPKRDVGVSLVEARAALAQRDDRRAVIAANRALLLVRAARDAGPRHAEALVLLARAEDRLEGYYWRWSLATRIGSVAVGVVAHVLVWRWAAQPFLVGIPAGILAGWAAAFLSDMMIPLRRNGDARVSALGKLLKRKPIDFSTEPVLGVEVALELIGGPSQRLIEEGRQRLARLLEDDDAWTRIAESDLDLVRQAAIELGTRDAVRHAARLGIFDLPGVDVAHLLDMAGSPRGGKTNGKLVARALDDRPGTHVDKSWSTELVAALVAVLTRTAPSNERPSPVAATDRAALLEDLASMLTAVLDREQWRVVLARAVGADRARASQAEDFGLEVRRGLARLDRDELGGELARTLRLAPEINVDIALLARAFQPLDQLWPITEAEERARSLPRSAAR